MARRRVVTAVAVIALPVAWIGCAKVQPLESDSRVDLGSCPSFVDDVAPLLQKNCGGCHGGQAPAADWDLTDRCADGSLNTGEASGRMYIATLTARSGKVIAAAGDLASPLLAKLSPPDGGTVDENHKNFDEVRKTLQDWVSCGLAWRTKATLAERAVHDPVHIMNRGAGAAFHGALVRSFNYDIERNCNVCHAPKNDGGSPARSCFDCCHQDVAAGTRNPKDVTGTCTNCHGQPPTTGAHVTHVGGTVLSQKLDCTACHKKPLSWDEPGHVLDVDKKVIEAPAALNFGPLAKFTPDGGSRMGDPKWDRDAGTCSYVYCHGGAFTDANAKLNAPAWKGGSSQAACGNCHGLPPSNHKAGDKCEMCHPKVAVGGNAPKVVDPTRHVDTQISLGDESGKCWACHGTEQSRGAPPRDLSGGSDPMSVSIGAHTAHVTAAHRLRGPLDCSDCHVKPTDVKDPGHIDHPLPAKVFPPEIAATATAFKGGAMPAWDHDAGKCSNVRCHGAGDKLVDDMSPKVNRTPSWTGGTTQAECGSCHGIPPVDNNHSGPRPITLSDCATCHPKTIDAQGTIIVTGPPGQETSFHIDGEVEP